MCPFAQQQNEFFFWDLSPHNVFGNFPFCWPILFYFILFYFGFCYLLILLFGFSNFLAANGLTVMFSWQTTNGFFPHFEIKENNKISKNYGRRVKKAMKQAYLRHLMRTLSAKRLEIALLTSFFVGPPPFSSSNLSPTPTGPKIT